MTMQTIPLDSTVKENGHVVNSEEIRYFWDGGLLSNTPLRELLDAHQEYWRDVVNKDEIPGAGSLYSKCTSF